MLYAFILFIFLSIIFFVVIDRNKRLSRTNEGVKGEFDGNGEYQYRGRGEKDENVETLLSRIDWLAKNASNSTSLYTTAYICSYAILLAIILILYAYSRYILSSFEMVLIFSSSFITIFSILNLFSFHTDKYPNYYIRKNIEFLRDKFGIFSSIPPIPTQTSLPHRTHIQDILST